MGRRPCVGAGFPLYAHGLQVSEALTLTWNDVQLEARKLRVLFGKGGKQRRVVFGETLRTALMAFKQKG